MPIYIKGLPAIPSYKTIITREGRWHWEVLGLALCNIVWRGFEDPNFHFRCAEWPKPLWYIGEAEVPLAPATISTFDFRSERVVFGETSRVVLQTYSKDVPESVLQQFHGYIPIAELPRYEQIIRGKTARLLDSSPKGAIILVQKDKLRYTANLAQVLHRKDIEVCWFSPEPFNPLSDFVDYVGKRPLLFDHDFPVNKPLLAAIAARNNH